MKHIAEFKISIFVLLGICLYGCGSDTQSYLIVTEEEQSAEAGTETGQPEGTRDAAGQTVDADAGVVCVYVCGEVISPGVYELPAGSRICDAVEVAGGMTREASREYWNLAEPLADGQMVCFPTEEEAQERQEAAGVEHSLEDGTDSDGRVNINTAACEQLMTLPGVGKARAEAIIAYREEHGRFADVEDIMKISGIKEALYAKLQDYITVD